MQNSGASSITEKEAMQHRTLWLSVIKQAMDDYLQRNSRYFRSCDKVYEGYFNSEDFLEICELAGIEPESIRQQIQRDKENGTKAYRKVLA